MTTFAHDEEDSRNCAKACRVFLSALKEYFARCQIFHRWLSTSSPEQEECPISDADDDDDDDDEEVVILAIRTRALEAKLRRKRLLATTESFRWVMSSPTKGDKLLITLEGLHGVEDSDHEYEEDENIDAFFSVESCFSCYSSMSKEAFFSVGSCFSHWSSGSRIVFWDDQRRSILREVCHCEGWPFGLCRKALLLPPLPKSPSESWSWHRCNRVAKIP